MAVDRDCLRPCSSGGTSICHRHDSKSRMVAGASPTQQDHDLGLPSLAIFSDLANHDRGRIAEVAKHEA
jgi:hypothetical protein